MCHFPGWLPFPHMNPRYRVGSRGKGPNHNQGTLPTASDSIDESSQQSVATPSLLALHSLRSHASRPPEEFSRDSAPSPSSDFHTQGRWCIPDPPEWLTRHYPSELPTWTSLDDALLYTAGADTADALAAKLMAAYRSYIEGEIDAFDAAAAASSSISPGSHPARLAACIMEPLLQGAGGMLVVEPGFQRALAAVSRSRGLPLILDEVFSGLYRLGSLSAGSGALGLRPDVACYGKLLTGGAVPMAVTLASREVFEAFSGPSKVGVGENGGWGSGSRVGVCVILSLG